MMSGVDYIQFLSKGVGQMEVMDVIEKEISFVRILKTEQESIINVCNVN